MYGSDILPELNFDFGGQNGGNWRNISQAIFSYPLPLNVATSIVCLVIFKKKSDRLRSWKRASEMQKLTALPSSADLYPQRRKQRQTAACKRNSHSPLHSKFLSSHHLFTSLGSWSMPMAQEMH
jgi:hypothetical protein